MPGCRTTPITVNLRHRRPELRGVARGRRHAEPDGEANDYVGKGLSGGKLIIRPSQASKAVAERSIVVGNTVLYGAIAGECYFRGVAGERFAVRNSAPSRSWRAPATTAANT